MEILWKGRECLNQETFEPAIELVGVLDGKTVSVLIDKQEIEDYRILTGRNLIDEKKRLLEKKLV
jgi:hypothetical protein